jgi:GT2 family glycosyltransferase
VNDIELSIIIVSFNTRDLLRNCLQSLLPTLNSLIYEIIVVDNASADRSAEMIETEFKQVRLIRNLQNVGFAIANNQAIKNASGRYLLLINSDTILKDIAIEQIIRFMGDHPKAAAAGPKILNSDNTLQSKGFSFPSIVIALIKLFRLPKILSEKTITQLFPQYFWNENSIKQVDWVSGCCILIRKETIEIIGMLSEDFFMYCEEFEWCYRAKKVGYEIWYFPLSRIKHFNMSSPIENRTQTVKISLKICYEKTIGIFKAILISLIYILSEALTMVSAKIKTHKTNAYDNAKESIKEEIKFIRFLLG